MINIHKWGMLYAMWDRHRKGLMSRYEAALSIYTIRLLFPGIESMCEFSDSRDFIPYYLCVYVLADVPGWAPTDTYWDELDDRAWFSVFSAGEMLLIVSEAMSMTAAAASENQNGRHAPCSRKADETCVVDTENDCTG